MDVRQELFPARRSWPPANSDVNELSADVTEARLVAGVKNLKSLERLTRLKALWCQDVNDDSLDCICNSASLESLFIENIKTGNLSCLSRLRNLSILGLERCSKVSSLEFLVHVCALRGLAITDFRNVHDLSPLGRLASLQLLAVVGSMWTRMKVESFSPLGHLRNLVFLHLTNIKADDESLRPLANLTHLKELDIANFYPMSEFSQLSKKLPGTGCTWFRPFLEIHRGMSCKVCNKHTMVMLTGKKSPALCAGCDAAKLDQHIKRWNQSLENGI